MLNTFVNINKASVSELCKLEGIGTSKAEKIIEYRNNYGFKDKSDLMKVEGIGEKLYESIKDFITV